MYILPSPALLSVFPMVAPTSGDSNVTIRGINMKLSSTWKVEILIGDSRCRNVQSLQADVLTCTLSYGTGIQNVRVSFYDGGIIRSCVSLGAVTQIDFIFGGIASNKSGGVLAAIPRPDIFGQLSNYAAAGPFPGYQTVADSTIHAVAFYGNNVYFGGSFLSVENRSIQYIASFDGKSFRSLGLGIDGPVYSLATYMGLLMVGGSFQQTLSALSLDPPVSNYPPLRTSGIAGWNGSHWFSVTENSPTVVHCIYVNDSVMYVSGAFEGEGVSTIVFVFVLVSTDIIF